MANSTKTLSPSSFGAWTLILIGAAFTMNSLQFWPENPQFWERLHTKVAGLQGSPFDKSKTAGENLLNGNGLRDRRQEDPNPRPVEQYLPWWENHLLLMGLAVMLAGVVVGCVGSKVQTSAADATASAASTSK